MDILPCAHCGKQDTVEIISTNYPGERKVVCNYHNGGCGANTAGGESAEEAIAAWNRRPVPTGYVLVPVESVKFCALTLSKALNQLNKVKTTCNSNELKWIHDIEQHLAVLNKSQD